MKINKPLLKKWFLIGLSITLLSACANRQVEEGSIGAWVGYQEEKLSDASYLLSYSNRDNPADELQAWSQIEGLWHQRAKELCGHDKYRTSAMLQGKPCRTHYAVYGGILRREKQCLMELKGRLDCQ